MIKPVSDRIFIHLEDEKTSSPLIKLKSAFCPSKANQGLVVAVGDEVQSVHVGDRVMFHPFDELETPTPNLIVIREKSLLGIFEGEK